MTTEVVSTESLDGTNLSRRRLLVAATGAAAPVRANAQMAVRLVKPAALRPGDLVGLITPSTVVTDPDSLALAEHTIEYFGLRPKLGQQVGKRSNYKESVSGRLQDLHGMFADPSVKAIFAVRGGFGASHLLDAIDYELIRKNPKILLGYSDITALHLAIHQKTGLVTFHGPVALSGFTPYTQNHFRRALFEAKPLGAIENPQERNTLRPAHRLRTVRPGRASGKLTGGNLSLVCATMGTPYEIDSKGKILFLEDTDEQPYAVDRMLTHLRLAGKLDQAAGIVFGECNQCGPREFRPSTASLYTLGETVNNILSGVACPVLYGLTIGHTSDQVTLPLGLQATLDAGKQTLTIEESAVV